MERDEDGKKHIPLGGTDYVRKNTGKEMTAGDTCGMKPKRRKDSSHMQHSLPVRIDNVAPKPAPEGARWEHLRVHHGKSQTRRTRMMQVTPRVIDMW